MSEPRLTGHILPNAATMVGVCLTVIGLIKVVEAGTAPRSSTGARGERPSASC
jgi:hypothetical protein